MPLLTGYWLLERLLENKTLDLTTVYDQAISDMAQSASYMQPEIVRTTLSPSTLILGLPQIHNFSSAQSASSSSYSSRTILRVF